MTQQDEERLHHNLTFSKQVWETLSGVDVNRHVQEKNGLKFLSWAWAWGTLMDYYPCSTYQFSAPVALDDGTMEVWVTLTISDGEAKMARKMWLPVMDYRNKAIENPCARSISDARMRCLTKAMAVCGLGHYIYAGEDIPRESKEQRDKYDKIAGYIIDALHNNQYDLAAEAWRELDEDEQKALWIAKTKGGYFTHDEKAKLRAALTGGNDEEI